MDYLSDSSAPRHQETTPPEEPGPAGLAFAWTLIVLGVWKLTEVAIWALDRLWTAYG